MFSVLGVLSRSLVLGGFQLYFRLLFSSSEVASLVLFCLVAQFCCCLVVGFCLFFVAQFYNLGFCSVRVKLPVQLCFV